MLPLATAYLVGFVRLLREADFPVAPQQAITFLKAITLLGPRSMDDIRHAALSALAPPPDRRGEFDSLFGAWFHGDADVSATAASEEETRIKDDRGARRELHLPEQRSASGELASAVEQLAARQFAADGAEMAMALFGRALPRALPKRRSFRHVKASSRGSLDLRRSLRSIVHSDGDIPRPSLRRRPHVQRKLLLLIDISGSMRLHTQDHLKVAHAIVRGADRAEVFTLGTRLTRVTAALRIADRGLALARAAETVEDWDGGTRIGPTLLAFLSMPRFAAFARGAVIVVLSDALERGGHSEMEQAFRRLKARAFRLALLTPLAADPRFRPRTAALTAVLPYLDDLADGSGIGPVTEFILSLARPAQAVHTANREAS